MRSVEEHLQAVLELAEPLAPVQVPVRAERGMPLAEDIEARLAVPPFDNSAMDGFAVRAADTQAPPVRLDVIDDVPAGTASGKELQPGQAIRIMTGSPLPLGADAIVPVELTDQPMGDAPLPEQVEIRESVSPGRHIRHRAEDVAVGDVVLRKGADATAAAAAAAASVGHGEWRMFPRPRVLVVATGSELVAPGEDLQTPGQIPDSNGLLLDGLARRFGAKVVGVLRVADDAGGFRDALENAPEADLIVTSGGVSVGAFEVVRQVTEGQVDFVTVAMQPGKPQGLGHWTVKERKVPFLALPGNPVSVFVSAWLFLRPLVWKLSGRAPVTRLLRMPTLEGWRSPTGRRRYVPVQITADGIRRAHGLGSGSHAIGSLHLADGLAVVPADVGVVQTGDILEVLNTND